MPPLWGSINVFQCFTQGLRPGLCGSIALVGLLADWSNSLSIICRSNYWIYWVCGCLRLLFGVVICACCRIYCSVSLFAFVVGLVGRCGCLRLLFGFIGWCRCLRLLSDLLVGAGVSAVGTTLLQSPGWNEGKARNETLGKHGQKRIELRRSGTFGVNICRGVVPP